MDALAFLTALWPADGLHCIAVLHYGINDDGERFPWWSHETFNSISNATDYALRKGEKLDVYWTMHTLIEKSVPSKIEGKKPRVRVADNTSECRTFFADLDIGKGYDTKQQGLAALAQFLVDTKLPAPWIVSSGKGFHLYWPLTEAIPSVEWEMHAKRLAKLAKHHKFGIDPARVSDRASVLRVPGTWHLKNPLEPLPVSVKFEGKVTETAEFLRKLAVACEVIPAVSLDEEMAGRSGLSFETPCTPQQLGTACGVFRKMVRTAHVASEPEWYAFLQLCNFTDEAASFGHKISALHPDYDRDRTESKLHQAKAKQIGPPTCDKLSTLYGDASPCAACWYKDNPTSSPVVAVKKQPMTKDDLAKPKPAAPEAAAETVRATLDIPLPPAPWSRLKAGGVMRTPPGEAGHVICRYDVYPVDILYNSQDKRRTILWEANLGGVTGVVQFETNFAMMADANALYCTLADNKIILTKNNLLHMREYMGAYIDTLQKYRKDNMQHSHLGWTDDRSEFILPEFSITALGPKPAVVNDGVLVSAQHVRRKGTLEGQVRHLEFYNRPEYVRQQFFIAAALSAPIFYATGHHGVIVNLSGESGGSKSTALYTGGSLWGAGVEYAINGTNNGATAKARNERVAILANLPVCVDEITHMSREDVKDLAMSITQPGHRIRLDTNAKEKKAISSYKATMMLCTSNSSLHETLSYANAAGTAGSMRVLEILCKRLDIHTKGEADDFKRGLNEHYGWIGPAFMEYVVAHREEVEVRVQEMMKRIDKIGQSASQERFWTDTMASTMVGLYISHELKLLPFDPEAVFEWLVTHQLPLMRSVVADSYADPVESLLSYVDSVAADLLVCKYHRDGSTLIVKAPRGELAGRLETDTRTLYISQSAFKEHCVRYGISINTLIRTFETDGIAKRVKLTLGKGTSEYNFGQIHTIMVDLKHSLVSGRAALAEVEKKIVPFQSAG